LFYLLSISGEQYKPVEWFGKLTATGTSGFGDSAYGAIRSVFNTICRVFHLLTPQGAGLGD